MTKKYCVKGVLCEFKYIMLVLGAIIGAGLASGQEIVVFFAQYGFISLFFVIPLFFIFYFALKFVFDFGNRMEYNEDFKNSKQMTIIESISSCFYSIIGASMLSGANELLNDIAFDFGFPLWSVVLIIVSSLIVFKGFHALMNVSTYLVPVILITIAYVCVRGPTTSSVSPMTFSTDVPNLAMLTLCVISYCCCNIVVSNKLLQSVGKKLEKKQIKRISLIISLVFSVIITLIIISLLINDKSVLFTSMPLVYVSFLINAPTGFVFSFVILISILTTLFTMQFSLNKAIQERLKINRYLSIFLTIITIFILSLFGFQMIVKYLYPVIGAFGFVMLFVMKDLKLLTKKQI